MWQQGRALTRVKEALSQVVSCGACLAAVASGCAGAPWDAAVVPCQLRMATLPGQAYTRAGSREHPGGSYKGWWQQEQGQGPQRGQCCCGCSQGQAVVGSAGVGLPLSSPAEVCVQNRGA